MLKEMFMRLTGWKHVTRGKRSVWYHPMTQYDGYRAYNYDQAITNAFQAMKADPKKYGTRCAIRFEVYFSSGRNGEGSRRVIYTIGKI